MLHHPTKMNQPNPSKERILNKKGQKMNRLAEKNEMKQKNSNKIFNNEFDLRTKVLN